jgi:hypothetical protein
MGAHLLDLNGHPGLATIGRGNSNNVAAMHLYGVVLYNRRVQNRLRVFGGYQQTVGSSTAETGAQQQMTPPNRTSICWSRPRRRDTHPGTGKGKAFA